MPWPYVVGYAVAGVSALTWRRSWPGAVFAVLLVHGVVGALFLPGYRPTLGLLVAFYTVASRTRLGWSLAAFAAIGVPSALAVLKEIRANPPGLMRSTLVAGTLLYFLLDLAVWSAGRWVRRSRHDLSHAEKRRQAAAAAAVAEERGRIAGSSTTSWRIR
jgi:signal transduction histidine kinase